MNPHRFHAFFRVGALACTLLCIQQAAGAQLNNPWVAFQQDQSRIVAAPGLGVSDPEEKDFAWGDLDQDGYVDLVIVRKQPFSTSGKRPNVLLMNEGGVLVDRTALYASSSDVPGDQGFLTPTNDRDVAVADLNGDGWLDVVTATTYALAGDPKALSHPRVYINLGQDASGQWLGLRYEEARIPQLKNVAGTLNIAPDYCAVAAGDVTGDGAPDLFFVDYGGVGKGERLLVNDGNGFFSDETAQRMSFQMANGGGFGMAGAIADLNGDGAGDVIHAHALGGFGIAACYNDPANVGFFNILESVYSFAPYHVSVGDLNRDGKVDFVATDDGHDGFRINTGNDALGRVVWSAPTLFTRVTGTEPGIGGNSLICDLDGDGWNDVIITDVDVDIPGCSRRSAIYHNLGTVVGAVPELREEAESATGWRGVVGMSVADQTGLHDVAAFDLDNDGDLDLVFGRCSGLTVWINQTVSCAAASTYCTAKTTSNGCVPAIGSTGTPSAAGAFAITCTQVEAGQPGLVFYGTAGASSAPFQGGLLCVAPPVLRMPVQGSGGAPPCGGQYSTPMAAIFATLPVGTNAWAQYWFRDPGAASSTGLSNGLSFTACP